MLTKLLHRLYGIVIIGCILLCPVLSGCDDDTVNGFLQFSDDNLLLGTAVKVTCGDNVVRLSVRQEPMVFEVTDGKKTLNFTKKVATDTLKIHTNMAWKVEIADTTGWLQVADTIGSGDAELVFTNTDNIHKK